MINGVKLCRVAILSLIYVNILVTTQSLLLMIGIWGRRGSKTAQNHVFFYFEAQNYDFWTYHILVGIFHNHKDIWTSGDFEIDV